MTAASDHRILKGFATNHAGVRERLGFVFVTFVFFFACHCESRKGDMRERERRRDRERKERERKSRNMESTERHKTSEVLQEEVEAR